MDRSKGNIVIPTELVSVLETDNEAEDFFNSLSDGYKRGYCDWVGGAKQQTTRETRAQKALVMLQKKQKTLKTWNFWKWQVQATIYPLLHSMNTARQSTWIECRTDNGAQADKVVELSSVPTMECKPTKQWRWVPYWQWTTARLTVRRKQ